MAIGYLVSSLIDLPSFLAPIFFNLSYKKFANTLKATGVIKLVKIYTTIDPESTPVTSAAYSFPNLALFLIPFSLLTH